MTSNNISKKVIDMPGGNGTGPLGMGPMTGRGMGYCAVDAAPGYLAYGFGKGMGRGRGYRRMCNAAGMQTYVPFAGYSTEAEEKELLQKRAGFLEKQLNQIRERLNELSEDK
jgi:hypothetical protein